ncbi:MAG: Arylsulfatase precursor [Verrucomicrobiota bacterium]|jgi:arylsulfatase A-like enzyme
MFKIFFCSLSCSLLLAAEELKPAPPPAPNVLVILADDLGYGDLGITGCKDIKTPNIDRLARRGIFCSDGHVAASVCAPSRCGLLTGLAPARQGFDDNGDMLLPESKTIAHAMRDAGYESLGVGKWHMGPEPMKMGFDHFTGLAGGGRSYFPSAKTGKGQRMTRDGQDVELEGWTYLTDFMTEEGMRMVKARPPGKAFFLYMSYTTPHTPLEPRPDLFKQYEGIAAKGRRNYAAMVASLDEEVGQWLDFLDKEGMAEDTLIVFLSDNGGATINSSDNGAWRGMKGSYWEGGQRIPFIVSWPGTLKPGIYDKAVSALDFIPTFLGAAGQSPKQPTDGVNLLPFLKGENPARPHRNLFWRFSNVQAVRDLDLMLIKTFEEDGKVHAVTLFDLASDPGQTRDLATARPEDRARLEKLLEEWNQTNPAPRALVGKNYRDNLRRKHEMDVIGRDAERKLP